MSAPYIIPFNHQPSLTAAYANSGVTVPSGKYARIRFTLSVTAYLTHSGGTAIGASIEIDKTDSNCTTGDVWLKAGDVISVSNSAPSGSVVTTAGVVNNITATSTSSILLGGTIISSVSAVVSASWTGSAADRAVDRNGTANVYFSYEEYNVIS